VRRDTANTDQVPWLTAPTQRYVRGCAILHGLADGISLPHPEGKLRAERAQGDGIDPKAVLRPLGGQHPRQRISGALGGVQENYRGVLRYASVEGCMRTNSSSMSNVTSSEAVGFVTMPKSDRLRDPDALKPIFGQFS
jgi:hypothetical protein